jgi:AcrR family transcriptional regulator
VTTIEQPHPGRRLTVRGKKTRAKIVEAATDLMRRRGVAATTLDDVVAAAGVSKSQLYSHFPGKDALVRAVIDRVGAHVLEREQNALGDVATIDGLRRWRDALVAANAVQHGAYGCALGSLAAEVADQDDVARRALSRLFGQWHEMLADAMRRIQESGAIDPGISTDDLATALMGALQGGYLLAQTAGDVAPMATSLDMALAYIENLAER